MTDDSRQEDGPEWAVTWGEVGRELLRGEMQERRFGIEEALREVEGALSDKPQDPSEVTEQGRQLRRELNRALHHVENHLAAAVGVEPWEEPPRIPMSKLFELTEHPRAEGVDPLDYVDDASTPEEGEQQ